MKNVFFVGVIVCVVVNFMLSSFNISRSSQRRIYWGSACLAAVSGFLSVYPNWKTGLGIGGFFLAGLTISAYAATPYIKIRGKIYALTVDDSRPDPGDARTSPDRHTSTDGAATADRTDPQFDPAPDSYSGMLTAATMWWILVVIAVISAVNVYAFAVGEGKAGVAAVGAGSLILMALGVGYGDASWDYRIARGQYIQLGLASVITAGSFALLYLIAYYAGRRKPLRSKHSMEYRAHPPHRESEP